MDKDSQHKSRKYKSSQASHFNGSFDSNVPIISVTLQDPSISSSNRKEKLANIQIAWNESQQSDLKYLSKLELDGSSSYLSKFQKKSHPSPKETLRTGPESRNTEQNSMKHIQKQTLGQNTETSIPIAKVNLMELLQKSKFLTSNNEKKQRHRKPSSLRTFETEEEHHIRLRNTNSNITTDKEVAFPPITSNLI